MPSRFDIVWQISPDGAPVVLRSETDANAATIAFSEELTRLRRHAAPGEVLVRSGDGDERPLVREGLNEGPASEGQEQRDAARHGVDVELDAPKADPG